MTRAKPSRKPRIRAKRSPRTRRTEVDVGSPAYGKIEAVVRLLPTNGDQVPSTWLLRRLEQSHGTPRRTAIRWLKEAEAYVPPGHHYPFVTAFKHGRQRLYGFNLTGFMDQGRAKDFLDRGAYIGFIREGPKLYVDYKGSLDGMTLFWK